MPKIKIAIIDILGLCYDGETLNKRGLGGSESAVISIARNLQKIGFDVTVFNSCEGEKDTSPGNYLGVEYIDIRHIEKYDGYDIVISSRSVAPFVWHDKNLRNLCQYSGEKPFAGSIFENIMSSAYKKILIMHDTFLDGDSLLEDLVVQQKKIDHIFTLSDFHTDYIANCEHGRKRNFEVLKPYIFQTRNGINLYTDYVNLEKKDRSLFVYNASATKGMVPLLDDIWARVKAHIPNAKLKIIGGFYKFRDGAPPDAQENTVNSYSSQEELKKLGVEFTGIIEQSAIAKILEEAGFMIYPAAFPETFGISTLESLAYGTPVITNRFGALEETAIDKACYKIDYAIEPNSLFPQINKEWQVEAFVKMVIDAYDNAYLYQQKQNACNLIRDVCTWDTVALQWKQFFFKILDMPLPVDDYRKVRKINDDVKRIFGRRFINTIEHGYTQTQEEFNFAIISPFYNCEQFIERHILSVAQQDYVYYDHYLIDDMSTDNSFEVAKRTIENLPAEIRTNFILIKNTKKKGAVGNQVEAIIQYVSAFNNSVIMLLDGDDWLVSDNTIFHHYNNIYKAGAEMTYGSCHSVVDNLDLFAQEYPPFIKNEKRYREYKFNWNFPYPHLRTFLRVIFEAINIDKFIDPDTNEYYGPGGDNAIFYNVIENCDPNRVKRVSEIIVNYNDTNPINDYKVHGELQTATANKIIGEKSMAKVTPNKDLNFNVTKHIDFNSDKIRDGITVVVPTMWRANKWFIKALEAYEAVPEIKEILIIDNDKNRFDFLFEDQYSTKNEFLELQKVIANSKKINRIMQEKNIYVNPAWNLGVELAKYEKICIANDDIVVDSAVFPLVYRKLTPDSGPFGMITGEKHFNHPESTDYSISIMAWNQTISCHGFGQFFFVHADTWKKIPENMLVYFGDDYVIHTNLFEKRNVNLIYNISFQSPFAQTVKNLENRESIFENDRKGYGIVADQMPIDFSKVPYPSREDHNAKLKAIVDSAYIQDAKITQGQMHPKKILIAIPTAKYIESDTFKSIYDLKIPPGYVAEFQFFYGYRVDQIRNLIADWIVKGFDYLFAVDSDIGFASNTLEKLLSHGVDYVSGIYRQREPNVIALELYNEDYTRMSVEQASDKQNLFRIGGSGFGCVLISRRVFEKVGYPYFEYHPALDHNNTFSEDVDFCKKATKAGFALYCDKSVVCDHFGRINFSLNAVEVTDDKKKDNNRLKELSDMDLMPKDHILGLTRLSTHFTPKVIYDIGSSVLHWTKAARKIWKNAKIIPFEAMVHCRDLYESEGINPYYLGVLSSPDKKKVTFYQNINDPGGNSYYKENQEYGGTTVEYLPHERTTETLDDVVFRNGYPLPDLIKMDVQGAELDIIDGALTTLSHAKYVILEVAKVEYNIGAPHAEVLFDRMTQLGFNRKQIICDNGFDVDYLFYRG